MIYLQLTTSPATVQFARALGGNGLHIGILGALPTEKIARCVDQNRLTRCNIAHDLKIQSIERHAFGRDHELDATTVFPAFMFADNQRTNTVWIPKRDEPLISNQRDNAVTSVDPLENLADRFANRIELQFVGPAFGISPWIGCISRIVFSPV